MWSKDAYLTPKCKAEWVDTEDLEVYIQRLTRDGSTILKISEPHGTYDCRYHIISLKWELVEP